MPTRTCPHCGARVTGGICEYCDSVIDPEVFQQEDPAGNWQEEQNAKARGSFKAAVIIITVMILIISTAVTIMAYNISKSNAGQNRNDVSRLTVSEISIADETETEEEGVYPAGTYKIGTDIPEGLYLLVGTQGTGNFSAGIYSDKTALDAKYFLWGSTTAYLLVEGSGYVRFSWAKAYDVSQVDTENDPFKHSGMFRVGEGLDLEPGTYTVVSDSTEYSGTWDIYSELTADGPVQKDFGWVNYGAEEVTVEEGEILELRLCRLRK
ncbi:MAG: zinc ribbon domain-containing protein [Ruminococcus sp.]|nr:zinc ribbon domain-containing protein [Ruminococcus sp.]